MTRKLATVRTISALDPIVGADRIELATVDGWKVIVQKELYKVGMQVIYLEIDSWVPSTVAPFLTREGRPAKSYNGILGERLKTMKMKGVLSQGLILPLSTDSVLEDGTDLTDTLGIQLFEREQGSGNGNGLGYSKNSNWPHFLQKTDQERIQNCFNDIKGRVSVEVDTFDTWEVTEKLDGSSMTVYFAADGSGHLGVCSRNFELVRPGVDEEVKSTFWKTAFAYNIPAALEEFCRKNSAQLALQGELIGPGIQGNKYNLTEHQFVVFDIYNITTRKYLSAPAREIVVKALGLPHVPKLGTLHTMDFDSVAKFLEYADGSSKLNAETVREGVVFKNIFDPQFSFKAISNKFLLKHGD